VKVALDGQALVGGAPTGFGIYAQLVARALESLARSDSGFTFSIIYPEPRNKPLAAVWQRLFWEQVRLPLHVRADRPDILHSPCLGAPIFPPVKLVCTIHDLISYREPPAGWFAQRYFAEIMPAGWRKAALIITDTETVREEVREALRIPLSRIAAVPLYSRYEGMAREHTPPAQPLFLLVGTVEPRKGFTTAIGALTKLPARLLGRVKLVIAGKRTDHTAELMAMARQLGVVGSVDFADYNESLDSLYARATALVFPSTAEGFGLPPLEAMSLGVPALIAGIPVLKEVYGEVDGFENPGMFAPGDEAALAELMRRAIEDADYYAELSGFAKQVAGYYTRERFARNLYSAYDAAMQM
jgi:glycosyltransferase involved in cell wall biosynthesis